MREYHNVEHKSIIRKDDNKRFWLKTNDDGTIDLCSTNIVHPLYVKQQELKKKEHKLEVAEQRRKRLATRKIAKLEAQLQAAKANA